MNNFSYNLHLSTSYRLKENENDFIVEHYFADKEY